jgi:hypothetical protein
MLGKVEFQPEDYGPEIARILDLAGGGSRPMPLVRQPSAQADGSVVRDSSKWTISTEACKAVANVTADASVLSGLYLYCGCWDAGHTSADSVENPNGYFWHAVAHRQEPDPANSAYWFRKTGKHPIFPKLAAEAAYSGYPATGAWDPFAFIEYCEAARRRLGSPDEQVAIAVQLLEWQLLFDYCARGQNF